MAEQAGGGYGEHCLSEVLWAKALGGAWQGLGRGSKEGALGDGSTAPTLQLPHHHHITFLGNAKGGYRGSS